MPDVPWWSFAPLIVAALAGPGLNHVFSRRAESIRALGAARTRWLITATTQMDEHQHAVMIASDTGVVGPPLNLQIKDDVDLKVLDRRGFETAWSMLSVHAISLATNITRRVEYFNSQPYDETAPTFVAIAPQVISSGQRMRRQLALWAQVNWRMPTWCLRLAGRFRSTGNVTGPATSTGTWHSGRRSQ